MKLLIAIPLILSVAACANRGSNHQPVLDGPVTRAYQADLNSCRQLARSQKQHNRDAWASAAVGAGAGAVLGALDDDEALGGAVAGALAGGAAGVADKVERREAIVVECLKGRGHRVVG